MLVPCEGERRWKGREGGEGERKKRVSRAGTVKGKGGDRKTKRRNG